MPPGGTDDVWRQAREGYDRQMARLESNMLPGVFLGLLVTVVLALLLAALRVRAGLDLKLGLAGSGLVLGEVCLRAAQCPKRCRGGLAAALTVLAGVLTCLFTSLGLLSDELVLGPLEVLRTVPMAAVSRRCLELVSVGEVIAVVTGVSWAYARALREPPASIPRTSFDIPRSIEP